MEYVVSKEVYLSGKDASAVAEENYENRNNGRLAKKSFSVRELRIGGWELKGEAVKTEKDGKVEWTIKEPFVARREGEERSLSLEEVEKLHGLVMRRDPGGLEKELCNLLGVEEKIELESRKSSSIIFRNEDLRVFYFKSLEHMFNFYREDGGWDIRFCFKGWEDYIELEMEKEVKDGYLRQTHEFEMDLSEEEKKVISKGIADIDNYIWSMEKDNQDVIAHGIREVLEKVYGLPLFKKATLQWCLERALSGGFGRFSYLENNKSLYVEVCPQNKGNWLIELKGKKLRGGKSTKAEDVGITLEKLLQETLETGSGQNLMEFCVKVFNERMRTAGRRA